MRSNWNIFHKHSWSHWYLTFEWFVVNLQLHVLYISIEDWSYGFVCILNAESPLRRLRAFVCVYRPNIDSEIVLNSSFYRLSYNSCFYLSDKNRTSLFMPSYREGQSKQMGFSYGAWAICLFTGDLVTN